MIFRMDRDQKWPLVVDFNELIQIFTSEYSLDANYQDDPFEGPVYHAAKALADRHQAFFSLLRVRQLVAEGIFKDTGQELPLPDKLWCRPDKFQHTHTSAMRANHALRSPV
jgi:hypothetical protein